MLQLATLKKAKLNFWICFVIHICSNNSWFVPCKVFLKDRGTNTTVTVRFCSSFLPLDGPATLTTHCTQQQWPTLISGWVHDEHKALASPLHCLTTDDNVAELQSCDNEIYSQCTDAFCRGIVVWFKRCEGQHEIWFMPCRCVSFTDVDGIADQEVAVLYTKN